MSNLNATPAVEPEGSVGEYMTFATPPDSYPIYSRNTVTPAFNIDCDLTWASDSDGRGCLRHVLRTFLRQFRNSN